MYCLRRILVARVFPRVKSPHPLILFSALFSHRFGFGLCHLHHSIPTPPTTTTTTTTTIIIIVIIIVTANNHMGNFESPHTFHHTYTTSLMKQKKGITVLSNLQNHKIWIVWNGVFHCMLFLVCMCNSRNTDC